MKWGLEKRYSSFEELRESLTKLLSNVPSLPGKSFFKISSYDGLNKRKIALEQFLKDCVTRKDIMTNESFREFIEIDKHSPELTTNGPNKISEFSDLPLGVRDFIYLKYENVILLACADMNIASRIDAYITNVNLPWEKKTDAHISVGAVFAYKVVQDSSGSYYFEKLWAKSFPKQVHILIIFIRPDAYHGKTKALHWLLDLMMGEFSSTKSVQIAISCNSMNFAK